MTARETLDSIRARGRCRSSTREERAQFRKDHARLVAALEAVLKVIDSPDWEGRPSAVVSSEAVRNSIVNALNLEPRP